MEMTVEQKRAVALAKARKAASDSGGRRPWWANKGTIGEAVWEIGKKWSADNPNYEPSSVPWLDPVNAFATKAIDSVPVIGPTLSRGIEILDAMTYGQTPEERRVINEADQAQYPIATGTGQVTGAVAPLAALGTTKVGGAALGLTGNLASKVGFGAGSGFALGSADMAARGGSVEDARDMGGWGAALGGALPLGGAAFRAGRNALSGIFKPSEANMLARAMKADQIDPANVPNALAQMGQSATIADLGPNLQGQAAALATVPGAPQRIVVDAMKARQAGGNERIRAAVDNTLGPAPVPSEVEAGIRANQQALGPEYEAAFRNARAVDTSDLALTLDSMAVNLRGDAQKAAQRVRQMLDVAGNPDHLDPNPYTLFQTRQAIDGMLDGVTDNNVRRVLSTARQAVDDTLAKSVPGIKAVDAKFEEMARQKGALGEGQQVLDSGRTAPRPSEVSERVTAGAVPERGVGPSAVPFRLSQGVRAEIERIIGTKANDRVALNQVLKGEGSWNYDRLSSVFGKEKADRLVKILDQERALAETENFAIRGSRTQPLKAAQDEMNPAKDKGLITEAMNLQFGSAAGKLADKAVGGKIAEARQEAMKKLAEILVSRGDDPRVLEDVMKALQNHQRGLLPPASAGVLASQQQNRPVEITVRGGAQ